MLRIEVIIEEKDEMDLPSSATSSKTGNNVNGEHFGSVPTRFSMIAIETVTFGQSWHSPTHREFPWLFRGPARVCLEGRRSSIPRVKILTNSS